MGGVNTAIAPGGNPVADNVTGRLNVPPSGGTVSGKVTSAPCGTVTGAGGATTMNPGATVTIDAAEVEVAEVALPEYTAVMDTAPTGRPLPVNVATPEEFTMPMPSNVAPLKKLTVPSDEPVGAGATVAVNVSICPSVGGFGASTSVVVVTASGAIVSITVGELDVAEVVLPE